jgi:hypothetical protein
MPPAPARGFIGQENVDEDTSQQQLEWCYQQKRAT